MTDAETDTLDILVTLQFGGDAKDERESLLHELASQTLAKDEGCLRYEWYRVKDRPNTYFLVERWASADAVKAHLSAPHLVTLFGRLQALTLEAFTPADLVRL